MLSLRHGGTSGTDDGKIIEINASKVEFGAPSFQEGNKIWQSSVPVKYLPNTGRDEIKITTR